MADEPNNTPSIPYDPRQGRFDAYGQSLGRLANFSQESSGKSSKSDNIGSLANKLTPNPGKELIDVVSNYKWTLSKLNDTTEVPYIRLREYSVNESQIKKQTDFYTNLGTQSAEARGQNADTKDMLHVYDALWPKDNPTKFVYKFPYFNETGFSLSTGEWKIIDGAGAQIQGLVGGAAELASNFGDKGKKLAGGIQAAQGVASFLAGGANLILEDTYPSVGIWDRPRIFAGHSNKTITISFPLYNTVDVQDWNNNRDLIYLLMSQNLFNKRDYITGVPPVFYDIYIPGQYFCYAATITDIKVDNLGNQRLLYGDYIAPDAYQVTLTLSEAVMPSRNQFEAINNGQAKSHVVTSTSRQSEQEKHKGAVNTVKQVGNAIISAITK